MTLGRLNTHITHLVSELAQFIVGETDLCLLHTLSVTNIDSEHAHYALPHCTMSSKPWNFKCFDTKRFLNYDFEQVFYVCFAYVPLL